MFAIQQAQLQAAGGQARCSHCENIFNAKKHLIQTEPEGRPLKVTQQPQNSGGAVSLNGLFEETEQEETDFPDYRRGTLAAGSERENTPNTVTAKRGDSKSKKPFSDSKTPEPDDEPFPLTEEQSFSASLKKHAHDLAAPEPFETELQQGGRQPVQIEEDVTSEGRMPDSITLSAQNRNARQGGHPLLWSVAILLLLTTALAQIVWFSRDNLKGYPEVRELLEFVCARTGCELPPWHEPERFAISSRSVRTHPMNNRALQIQLVFNNTARFPQPLPRLQLRLYDIKEKLSAQRVFFPEEYLTDAGIKTALIMPDQSVEVDMALADPGADVTGFKIDFL